MIKLKIGRKSNMTNTIVQYIRKGTKQVGCVVARKTKVGRKNVIRLAWSKCMTKPTVQQRAAGFTPDKYSKKKGLSVATNRLSSVNPSYNLELSCIAFLNQNNSPEIPSIVRKNLRKMAERARRYFKVRNRKSE